MSRGNYDSACATSSPIIWATRPITAVSAVIVTVSTIVLAWREVTTAATGRRATTTSAWGAATTKAITITAGIEAPRGRWRSSSPLIISEWRAGQSPGKVSTHLDLQEVIPTNALVVHLVIGVIRITAALVLDKCKPTSCVNELELTPMWIRARLTDGSQRCEVQGCRNGQGDRSCEFAIRFQVICWGG